MKTKWTLAAGLVAAVFVTGCETVPPGVERGPHGTIAYEMLVEASPPGARIEANGEVVGETPLRLKIFGDRDGTFHDFGAHYYVVRALPLATNQYPQVRLFQTGRLFTPQDRIPERIFFDMDRPAPAYAPAAPYGYPDYGPPPAYYYGPRYYHPAPYYGPHFRLRLHRRF